MKSANAKVVYTAVFGKYDRVPDVNTEWDCDFVCFTDNVEVVSEGWQVVLVSLEGELPAQANRRYKMLPHRFFPNYEYSLYIDGNIKVLKDPSALFNKYLEQSVIAIPKHQDRNCAYAEARLCVKGGRVDKEIVEKQMARYSREGFPENFGMTENGVIFRRHHDSDVIALMEAWWKEYCCGGRRDQLSLSYLVWKNRIEIVECVEGPRICKNFFAIELHAADQLKSPIKQFARKVNGKKHLSYFYLIMSKIISLIIIVRGNVKL